MSIDNPSLQLQYPKTATTVETLANAVELTKAILREVVGNEISDSINNMPLTDSIYNTLIVTELRKSLSQTTGI